MNTYGQIKRKDGKRITIELHESMFSIGDTVKIHSKYIRSTPQNALYWAFLEWCFKICPALKKLYGSPEGLHEVLKKMFLDKKIFLAGTVWLEKGSTAELEPGEFSRYLDYVELWIIENHGVDTSEFWKHNAKPTAIESKSLRELKEICNKFGKLNGYSHAEAEKQLIEMYCQLWTLDRFTIESLTYQSYKPFRYWLLGEAMDKDFLTTPPWKLFDDKIYLTLLSYKLNRCAICGTPAVDGYRVLHEHHLQTVKSQGTRKTDGNMRVIKLCAECHHEAHTIGLNKFIKKYHLQSITIVKNDITKMMEG